MTTFVGLPNMQCGCSFDPTAAFYLRTLRGEATACERHQAPIDVWAALLDAYSPVGVTFGALAPTGSLRAIFSLEVEVGDQISIELAHYGIPEDARVISAIWTPEAESSGDSPVVPFFTSGNSMTTTEVPHHLLAVLLPLRAVQPTSPHKGKVNALIQFRTPSKNHSVEILRDALEAHARRRCMHTSPCRSLPPTACPQ